MFRRFLWLMSPLLICTAVYAMDIHSMVAGDQMLYIQDSRQFTSHTDGFVNSLFLAPDGKNIVYTTITPAKETGDTAQKLILTDTIAGRTMVLSSFLGSMDSMSQKVINGGEGWMMDEGRVQWSPDSKSIAFTSIKMSLSKPLVPPKPDNPNLQAENPLLEEQWLQIYTYYGKHLASILLPDAKGVMTLAWSPDSKGLPSPQRKRLPIKNRTTSSSL